MKKIFIILSFIFSFFLLSTKSIFGADCTLKGITSYKSTCPDEIICNLALRINNQWDYKNSRIHFVAEAARRGLSCNANSFNPYKDYFYVIIEFKKYSLKSI